MIQLVATPHTGSTHVTVSQTFSPQPPLLITSHTSHNWVYALEKITDMLVVPQSLCTYTHYFSCLRCIYPSHPRPLSMSPRHASHSQKPIIFFFKMLDSEGSQRGPLIYTCDSISNLITVDHPLCYPVTPVTFL